MSTTKSGGGVFAERGRVDELRGTKRITRDVELLECAQEASIPHDLARDPVVPVVADLPMPDDDPRPGCPEMLHDDEAGLVLELLQVPGLVHLQSPELLTPSVVRLLTDPELPTYLAHRLAVRQTCFGLPQCRDDLLRRVSPSAHC
jgi:hypothetical protein